MRKTSVRIAAFPLVVALLLGACSSTRQINQIDFGVWAADKELWDEAIFRWQRALLENPNSVAAHNNLAVAYEKKGLWEEARREYEIALQLAPENRWVKANYKSFQANLESVDKDKKDKEETGKKDEKN